MHGAKLRYQEESNSSFKVIEEESRIVASGEESTRLWLQAVADVAFLAVAGDGVARDATPAPAREIQRAAVIRLSAQPALTFIGRS
ncbi:unnamed protein product [Calypogeia fissa]